MTKSAATLAARDVRADPSSSPNVDIGTRSRWRRHLSKHRRMASDATAYDGSHVRAISSASRFCVFLDGTTASPAV